MPRFDALNPAGRRLAASVGSLNRWARVHGDDARRAATQPARDARLQKLADQIDPDRLLPEHERAAAARRLRTAHMRTMALASAEARRKRAA